MENPWFFAAVMMLEMPDPNDRDELDAWAEHAFGQWGNAGLYLRAELERDDVTAEEQVTTYARLVELYRRFAETFVRAWIPTDMLDDENRSRWCDGLAAQMSGVVDQMEQYAASCRATAADASLTGWWDEVCAAP